MWIRVQTSISIKRYFSTMTSSHPLCNKPNLETIRNEFRKLEGGQVKLTKNDEDGIALICIDHPQKKNGFSGKMMVDLNEIVGDLEKWKTGKGIILYGAGDIFSSGGFLDTVREICNYEGGYQMSSLMQNSVTRLRQLPFISIAIAHGIALGGGAELLLSTDYRLMCSEASISFVQAKMGVGTGWGGGFNLTKLIGRNKALELLLTCRKIQPEEALKIGLVDEIIPLDYGKSGELRLEFARSWLRERVGSHSHSVVQTIKNIVKSEDLDIEREVFAQSWGGPDQLQALSANIKHK